MSAFIPIGLTAEISDQINGVHKAPVVIKQIQVEKTNASTVNDADIYAVPANYKLLLNDTIAHVVNGSASDACNIWVSDSANNVLYSLNYALGAGSLSDAPILQPIQVTSTQKVRMNGSTTATLRAYIQGTLIPESTVI